MLSVIRHAVYMPKVNRVRQNMPQYIMMAVFPALRDLIIPSGSSLMSPSLMKRERQHRNVTSACKDVKRR
jgi:hypothetical protein